MLTQTKGHYYRSVPDVPMMKPVLSDSLCFSAVVKPLHSNHDKLIGLLTPVPKYFRAKIHTFPPPDSVSLNIKALINIKPHVGVSNNTHAQIYGTILSIFLFTLQRGVRVKIFLSSEKISVTQHSRKTTLSVKHFDGADFKPPLKRLW